jgi:hypothetical protein
MYGFIWLLRNLRDPTGASTSKNSEQYAVLWLGQFKALFDPLNAFKQSVVARVLPYYVGVQIGDFAPHGRHGGF